MNTISECVRNYLIVINSVKYKKQLYKLCLERVKDGSLIVLITSEIHDFSRIITELCVTKDQLKNFIIMLYNTIEDISGKLLLLHSWSLQPSLIAVDLFQLLNIETEISPTSGNLMQKIALCAAALLVYLESIGFKATRIGSSNSSIDVVNGLLIVQTKGENFTETQVKIIKDLYFYKTELSRNVDEARTLLLQK